MARVTEPNSATSEVGSKVERQLIDKETSNASQQQASYQMPVYAHEVHDAISGESAASLTQERI